MLDDGSDSEMQEQRQALLDEIAANPRAHRHRATEQRALDAGLKASAINDIAHARLEHPPHIAAADAHRHPRRRTARDARRVLDTLNADPLVFLARTFNRMADDDTRKTAIALELLPYAYPKLKAVDHSGIAPGAVVQIVIGGEHVHAVDGDSVRHERATDTPDADSALTEHADAADAQSDDWPDEGESGDA